MMAWGAWKNRDLKFKKRDCWKPTGGSVGSGWVCNIKVTSASDAKTRSWGWYQSENHWSSRLTSQPLMYQNDCYLCHDLGMIIWRHLMSPVHFCVLVQHLWSTYILACNKLQCAHDHATCIYYHTKSSSAPHTSFSQWSLVNNTALISFVNSLQGFPKIFLEGKIQKKR